MASVGALFLLAFAIKAAAFPVNAWLPASYHAPPAALSALLAGLLTKVGIYALLRTLVALLPAARETLEPVIAVIAVATMLVGPLGAVAETNQRRAIGFILIGGIGVTLAGLALASEAGIAGATLYVFHAILTMTALYLVAGLVEKATGETDSRQMGGLYAASAPISILFFIGVLAASGTPPFLGFWPKLLLLQAGAHASGLLGGTVMVALVLNALLTLIAGTRLWAHIFWRQRPEGRPTATLAIKPLGRRGTSFGLVPTGVLVAAILVASFWPDLPVTAANRAAQSLIDPASYIAAVGLEGTP
jgi:multicomponent Na+:H+ antiporter subunit D